MPRFFNNILLFVILIALQTFVLSHFVVSQFMSLYIFIMIVIMANMQAKGWVMLVAGFLCGGVVDLIEGGGGIFAATTTWLAFVRPQILSWTAGREATLSGGMPTTFKIGIKRFFTYVTLMVLLWTIPFFSLEAGASFSWIYTPIRIVVSSFGMIVLIYFLQLPFNRNKYDV